MSGSEAAVARAKVFGREGPESGWSAYSLLPLPVTVVLVGALVVVTAVAWVFTVREANSMDGMVMGLGQVGGAMANDMTVAHFFGMWALMMVAMMTVTVAPVILAHRYVESRRGEGPQNTLAFLVGYFVVWTAVGVVPFVAFLAFRDLAPDAFDSAWLPWLAGALLVGAGTYQFSRRKTHCRQACCSPMAFVAGHDKGKGIRSAFSAGLWNGVDCLGCCWALMTVLVVVGLMNLVWMAALTALFFVEKHWRGVRGLSQALGVALIVLGIAVVARPSLLHRVSGVGDRPPPMSDMANMHM